MSSHRTRRPFHRITAVAIVAAAVVSACGAGDDDSETASTTPAGPATPVTAPAATRHDAVAGGGEVSLTPGMTWQWQLQGDVDTSFDVDLYDVDLFDTPVETIDRLRRDGRVVICYFSTAYEDWRPDADRWPARALGEALDD